MHVGVVCIARSVVMAGCQLTRVRSGIVVNGGASLTVSDTSFGECVRGLDMPSAGTVAFRDCGMHNGTVGVLCMGASANISLERVDMHGMEVGVDVHVESRGTASVKMLHCSVVACEQGVVLHDRAAHACVEHVAFDRCSTAVQVGDSATGELRNIKVSEADIGVYCGPTTLGEDQTAHMPCNVCGQAGKHAAVAAWAALRAVPPATQQPRCMHEGARSRVLMEYCEVQECSMQGVFVHTHAHLTARRVRLLRCGVLEEVLEGSERSVFDHEGCEVNMHGGFGGSQKAAVAYIQRGRGPEILTDCPADIPGILVYDCRPVADIS